VRQHYGGASTIRNPVKAIWSSCGGGTTGTVGAVGRYATETNGDRTWTLEAASPSELAQKGWSRDTLKVGDQITVDGFKAKSKPTTASARVIELPGGKKMPAADDSDGGPKSADIR
jgi:Family of unknown function (DUF6152)